MSAPRPPTDKVRLKRVYDAVETRDGFRILVDRLWPRGLGKEKAGVDLWMKEVAPSTELRRWYHKDLKRWSEFCARYKVELADNPVLGELRSILRKHTRRNGKGGGGGRVTLLYGAKDTERNHAIVLREMLLKRGSR